jgi:amino acid permease
VIALFSIAYLVILVLAHYIKGDTLDTRGTVRALEWAGPVSAFTALPVIVFAYTCHQNMFSVLNEVANNSHFHTTTIIFASIGGACALYVLTGTAGYLSYGDNVKGNIVSMYPTAAATTIARFAIVVLAMFSYPLQIHPCRESIDACMKWRPGWRSRSQKTSLTRYSLVSNGAAKLRRDMSDMRFVVLTMVLVVLSFITAMIVRSLNLVLAFVGSTGSTTISFILPGIFYYKISDPKSAHHRRLVEHEHDESRFMVGVEGGTSGDGSNRCDWRCGLLRNAALFLATYGLLVMVICLGINIVYGASGH